MLVGQIDPSEWHVGTLDEEHDIEEHDEDHEAEHPLEHLTARHLETLDEYSSEDAAHSTARNAQQACTR